MWYYLDNIYIIKNMEHQNMDKKYAFTWQIVKSNISIKLTIIACYLVRIESNAMTVQKTRSVLCEIYIVESICAVYTYFSWKLSLISLIYLLLSLSFILPFSNLFSLFSSLLHDLIWNLFPFCTLTTYFCIRIELLFLNRLKTIDRNSLHVFKK